MLKGVYYNEFDPFAAAWLRELIKEGVIADGEVDERDIKTISPDEIKGFAQCHFFAGIGGWSYALRLAGWPDDRPVWTGSCPCQPFSAAGAGIGGDDPRHLWPTWFHLIRECRPAVVFGEQVAAAVNHGWIDLVFDDLEGAGYACGAVDLPACGVGAFHIRQRLWFVADAQHDRAGRPAASESRGYGKDDGISRTNSGVGELADADGGNTGHRKEQLRGQHGLRAEDRRDDGHAGIVERPEDSSMADGDKQGRDRLSSSRLHERREGTSGHASPARGADGAQRHDADGCGELGGLSDAENTDGRRRERGAEAGTRSSRERGRRFAGGGGGRDGAGQLGDESIRGLGKHGGASGDAGHVDESGAVDGLGDGSINRREVRQSLHREHDRQGSGEGRESFWADVEWIPCRDGKARPVKPGIFPLAHGVSNRVGTLRGAGNAIVPQAAAEVIAAYLNIRS